MTHLVDVDHLVVGAGAPGLAFTDALIDHADVRVALVDRREGVGGHWREAYPFVRLHQASTFYGVASTVLGGGLIQHDGPEAGLAERADQPMIMAYYDRVVAERMVGPGRVRLFTGCDYLGGPHVRLPRHRRALQRPRPLPGRRRPLPLARHPGGDRAPLRAWTAPASSP